MIRSRTSCVLTLTAFFFVVSHLAAAPVVNQRVPADGTVVRTGVMVQAGEWVQLTPTGTWRVFAQVGFTDYRGHADVIIEGATWKLGALMVQIGQDNPAPLADTLPFQAATRGEILLWCNYGAFPRGMGEGALDVAIATGSPLAAVRQKADEARKQKEAALAADTEVQACLDAVNVVRRAAGLTPVTLSVDLSEGCTLHARYLAINWGNPAVEGLKAHQEQESLKGYTEQGTHAGAASVINYVSPSASVASWVGTFYHRIPLMQPDLREIGIGYTRGGPGWISVLDCVSALSHDTQIDYVRYPARDQTGVPRSFQDEVPSPVPDGHAGSAGFPVTVYFARNQKVSAASLTLVDSHQKSVTGYYSDPEHPATFFDQWHAVCLIPSQALKPGERYTARLSASVDGRQVDDTWSFTAAQGNAGGGGVDSWTVILMGMLIGAVVAFALYLFLTIFH